MNIVFKRIIEVKYSTDILIVGGGPAGTAAALAASRTGAKILLIEGTGCMGGLGTAGLVPAFMQFENGKDFLADGVGREVLERMWSIGGKIEGSKDGIKVEALKRAYDELLSEAGIHFLYMTQAVALNYGENSVQNVICYSKSGIFAVKAKVYIDATGDGDLCYWAGVPYGKGDEKGKMMAGTLCSLWGDINWKKVQKPDSRALELAFEENVFSKQDRHLPGMWKVGEHIGGGNIGHTYGVDGTDEQSLTEALVTGRRQMMEYETYYNKYLKEGYEDMVLISTANALGIRETRRIVGDYMLNLNDFINRATFDDEIGRYCYPVDIHASDDSPEGYSKYSRDFSKFRYKKGESYGIPYRILCPKGMDNLLVAGRCVSTDRYMQSSIRVMPGCYITGQAAGIAAALAIAHKNDIRAFDVSLLQKGLKKIGAFLPNYEN